MKKQLIAAAVATSVSAIAMADVSITGGMKANYTYTDYGTTTVADKNQFKHETDLSIKGKSGDTNVVINMSVTDQTSGSASSASGAGDADSTNTIEDVYMTTNVAGIDVKMGQWDNGNNYLRASGRNGGKFEGSTTVGGLKILYGNNNGDNAEYVTLSGDVAGVAASYKKTDSGDEFKLGTTLGGVKATYHAVNSDTANKDRNSIELATSVGGVDLMLVKAEADTATCLSGDTWLGDFEDSTYTCNGTNDTTNVMNLSFGQDITGIKASTSLAGNTVTFENVQIDDVAAEDTTINQIIVTRPLASGATFELTYTDLADDSTADDDYESLDLELAVKF
jgi:hypothetical protein